MKHAAPRVTVLLVTYNHERYVAQAIESVLAQRTEFDVEILISEDCSTDGTRAIVAAYQERHPDRIRLLLSDKNLRNNEVIARGIRAARGEFVAYLDGDDYWSVTYKLQRQVEFFDAHPACTLTFHNVLKIYEGQERPPQPSHPVPPGRLLTAEDLLATPCINSCAIMFRRAALPTLPDWYYSADLADWGLTVLLADQGPVGYVDELMGVYRMHAGGVWARNSRARRLEQRLEFYDRLDHAFAHKYRRAIRLGRATCRYELAREAASADDSAAARRHLRASFLARPLRAATPRGARLRLGARVAFPGLYAAGRRLEDLVRRLIGHAKSGVP